MESDQRRLGEGRFETGVTATSQQMPMIAQTIRISKWEGEILLSILRRGTVLQWPVFGQGWINVFVWRIQFYFSSLGNEHATVDSQPATPGTLYKPKSVIPGTRSNISSDFLLPEKKAKCQAVKTVTPSLICSHTASLQLPGTSLIPDLENL